ncbi:hypothetical protein Taro_055009, partial [Colocasia esculenta]|nr:hypothetical protein [Colocasia esculenta]
GVAARSLGLRQSAVEFPSRGQTPRPGRSFRGLYDTTDWRVRAREQIDDWEHRGKRVRFDTVSDDAYLQVFALKYGAKVYRGARRQVTELRTATDRAARLQEEVDAERASAAERCLQTEMVVAERDRLRTSDPEQEQEKDRSQWSEWCFGQAIFGRFLQSAEERGGGEALSQRD